MSLVRAYAAISKYLLKSLPAVVFGMVVEALILVPAIVEVARK